MSTRRLPIVKRLWRRIVPKTSFGAPTVLAETPHEGWLSYYESQRISLKREPIFDAHDRFFTIGSCFAEEIRKALTARRIRCLPDYARIAFDPARVRIDTLPKREHMNYYNTFSIRQEFERAAEVWKQDDSDIWEVGRDALVKHTRDTGPAYQDPYRRRTFGLTPADLLSAIAGINSAMADGLREATAVIMTLGLTEVFVKKDNGLVVNQVPGYGRGGGQAETAFHASTFAENLNNVQRSVALLKEINPAAKVVITVSPVPLARTFSGEDIYVANMRSKSTLLAVAREACKATGSFYFPSYEIVTAIGRQAFAERDGRHVRSQVVDGVIGAFIDATFRDASALGANAAAAAALPVPLPAAE